MKKSTLWSAILMALLCIAIAIGFGKLVINSNNGKQVESPQEEDDAAPPPEKPAGQVLRQLSTLSVVKKRIKGLNAISIKRNLK